MPFLSRFSPRLCLCVTQSPFPASAGQVRCVDHKTVFCVFYRQERKGKLFNFTEGTRGARFRFEFVAPEGAGWVNTDTLSDIDAPLLAAFTARAQELG